MKIPFGKVILTLVMVSMMVFGSIGTAQASEPLYYYEKYNLIRYDNDRSVNDGDLLKKNSSNYSIYLYRDYYFSSTEGYQGTNGERVFWADISGNYYYVTSTKVQKYSFATRHSDGDFDYYYETIRKCDIITPRKGSFVGTVTGTINQYPSDGLQGDYWYVRKGLVNNNPTLTLSNPGENDYFGKEKAINVSGSVKDVDNGDTLSVKYTINGISTHTNKTLQTITANGSSQSFSNSIPIDSSIPQGIYTLKIWVEDDKGGKSNEISRTIKIDKTSPTMKIIVGK
ncbi:hypothetical protein [Sporanaerobacter acetigenes]|uniref:Ig-like domain (Group 3) n=1 Tax=Sporanaerobacter acetigenes DSM 13106 TaxID=1123281 RepID=A0A1M5U7D8_9FIRM|nr:hypothetical protein [Sporanaerobacter acetigenes]SHH58869.1 hypothetical protein SAMN02745180_00548 [Sporanaerobacter acetigenes DSM 13106]